MAAMSKIGLIGYPILFILYAYYKYAVAAPDEFSAAYAQSVAVLVLLTAIPPFILGLAFVRGMALRGFVGVMAAAFVGVILCVAGYAAYWWFFLAPIGGAPAVYDVAPRGIGWGLAFGALAGLANWSSRSEH